VQVPLTNISALGVEGNISEFFSSEADMHILEEGCDYGRFIAACYARDIILSEIQEPYVERFNRFRPHLGDLQYSPNIGVD
jgi:hypothetical protein